MTVASFPMYDRPELAAAHDRYWTLICEGLEAAAITAPPRLTRAVDPFSTWTDPDLVLSQTCGMPYRNRLHRLVALIGTPDYGLADCAPGYYRSAIIARRGDRRRTISEYADAVLAYNQHDSQSGFCAPYHHAVGHGFWFDRTVSSGSHQRSVQLVADGTADVAAIDAVTWRLIERHDRIASAVEVIDWTVQTPGLPYISRAGADRAVIAAAVETAIDRLDPADREALGIRGLVRIPAEAYLEVQNPPPGVLGDR